MNESIENFKNIFNSWIESLDGYNYEQLITKPTPEYWSLGQLHMHIINETSYYFDQVRICLTNNDNENETASVMARIMFLNNAFPDERIQGDPSQLNLPQPESKDWLKNRFTSLKAEMYLLSNMISVNRHTGKTQHPGLNYFSASEWFQFAEMHFRHHEKQKQRIDSFLKTGTFVL